VTAPDVLHAAAVAALKTIGSTRVTVFEADVPNRPPALADGRVLPYVVVWPGPGATATEQAVTGPSGLDWSVQVTVAAGDVTWCLQACTLVRGVLHGKVLVTGTGPLVDDTPRGLTVTRDPALPDRWFAPLIFACLNP